MTVSANEDRHRAASTRTAWLLSAPALVVLVWMKSIASRALAADRVVLEAAVVEDVAAVMMIPDVELPLAAQQSANDSECSRVFLSQAMSLLNRKIDLFKLVRKRGASCSPICFQI